MMAISDRIRELIQILRDEDLDEIEVRSWFSGIRVTRRKGAVAAEIPREAPAAEVKPAGEPAPAAAEPEPAPAPEPAPVEDEGLEEFVSPMVGTFYRSAGPETDPFVSEGTRVDTGQVLCIIEAMKLMNEIEAEKSGVIRKILVEDAQPVEFGQPLFLVESA
jgi:acetyl-CoA carboxylase biotin carboxyl carrier protein